jgi:hypothetical protein
MDVIRKLTDLGFYVKRSEGRTAYLIFDFRDEGSPEELEADVIVEPPDIKIYTGLFFRTLRLSIFRYDESWELYLRGPIPGPGADSFSKEYFTNREALDAALNYFTGEPTLVDSWLVPFHKHPELNPDRVHQVIQSAKQVSAAEYETIEEERWSQNPISIQGTFLDIPHQTDPSIILKLRRDEQEAFVVSL